MGSIPRGDWSHKLTYLNNFKLKCMDDANVHVDDMAKVSQCIKAAQEHGLLVEVVTWAIYAVQADPNITPHKAMLDALYEWDCI